MADVVKLNVVEVGDGYVFDTGHILKCAGEAGLKSVFVAGWDAEGEMHVWSSHGGPETLWLLEHAKADLISGDG